VRQHNGAAHQLVGLLGIDAQTQSNLNRLIKLNRLNPLGQILIEGLQDTFTASSKETVPTSMPFCEMLNSL
jgi:hypothetical protein